MPWSPEDSVRFKKGIGSDKSKRRWADVANSVLQRTGSESAAIRAANGVTRDAIKRRLTRG